MAHLPTTDRLLLGPGPSPVSAHVMAALTAAPRSHLDPDLMAILDAIRGSLGRLFRAEPAATTLAVSGTGTSGLEAVVANLAEPGRRALVVVSGYFGDRFAQLLARYGCEVSRLDVEWGRAVDPDAVRQALRARRADLVAVVHAETSTGVRNPVADLAPIARDQDALLLVDAVTSLGAMPLEMAAWGIDACFSCSQKGLGAPSGLAPVAFSERALGRRVVCRSFYLDLGLLEDYWVRRKYHHTISAPLVYALSAALQEVEAEGLPARWQRHEHTHLTLVDRLAEQRLSLFPAPADRLWSLNTVRVPEGVNEATVRRRLLEEHAIEIGAGLGPLAGRIWRVGLMGSGSTVANVDRLMTALSAVLGSAS
jgi:alanine-glyoxylate transaminase/serine-glyoxylate transaminase/serine-pyruvate transaminase